MCRTVDIGIRILLMGIMRNIGIYYQVSNARLICILVSNDGGGRPVCETGIRHFYMLSPRPPQSNLKLTSSFALHYIITITRNSS